MNTKQPEYHEITEYRGAWATLEQISRLYQRYRFAFGFAEGKDVLEVACGSGLGLGYLASSAKSVVGVDIDEINVEKAKKHYRDSCQLSAVSYRQEMVTQKEKIISPAAKCPINVQLMDAHALDIQDNAFDLVLLFEAIYYLRDPGKFIREAKRVLRNGGRLIICTVNKDWEDFHPSPHAHKYFSVPELYSLLRSSFGDVKFYAGFRVDNKGIKNKALSLIKHAALKFNLIPGSLAARAYLKRIFVGKLVPLPSEVYEGMAEYNEPVEIPCDEVCSGYKIVYAVCGKVNCEL